MLDLNAIGKKANDRESYQYEVIAVDKASDGRINALKAKRDDGKETTFTAQRFAELRESGKLTVLGETTFSLKLDKDFDPNSRWSSLD